MNISSIQIFRVHIPFQLSFSHASRKREKTSAVIVQVFFDNGLSGYGEGTPREYVTGETYRSCAAFLLAQTPQLPGRRIAGMADFLAIRKEILSSTNASRCPSAVCALEMALLDALGKYLGLPLSRLVQPRHELQPVTYSAILPFLPLPAFEKYLQLIASLKIPHLKLKIGSPDDLIYLKTARAVLGEHVDIRADANNAWSLSEALNHLDPLLKYRLSAIEEPLKRTTPRSLRSLIEALQIPVILDESFRTRQDMESLLRAGLQPEWFILNLRLSKCGGYIQTRELALLARKYHFQIMMGCHVGETGILAAAGRHFAQNCPDLRYVEGAFGKMLLQEDVIEETLQFGSEGKTADLDSPGLGVTIKMDSLLRYSKVINTK